MNVHGIRSLSPQPVGPYLSAVGGQVAGGKAVGQLVLSAVRERAAVAQQKKWMLLWSTSGAQAIIKLIAQLQEQRGELTHRSAFRVAPSVQIRSRPLGLSRERRHKLESNVLTLYSRGYVLG